MPRPKTKTNAQIKNDYAKKAYDDIRLQVPKGQKDIIKSHADNQGETIGGFIKRAINETMQRDKSETVRYTGLTDKNGKKIFEGDIVQYYGTNPLEVYIEKGHTKIRYFDTVANTEYTDLFFGYDEELGECEVIGNIRDNPKLMESE